VLRHHGGVDLEAVATELYGRLPSEFVAARDARSGEARAAGDRQLATAIKAMRRPTTSAWLANWLARERAEELGRLIALGAAMRQAQDHLAGDQLRQLSRQRHQVVAALASEAARAAAEAGLTVGGQAASELEETLQAAMADPGAADALRSAHLTVALHHTGFGPTDSVQPPPRTQEEEPEQVSEQADQEAETRRRHRLDAATAALRQAESVATDAASTATEAQRVADEARARLGHLREEVAELTKQLAAAQSDEAMAATTAEEADKGTTAAQVAATDAAEAVAAAQKEVDRWQ
jgi:hypothetical protein